MDDTPHSVKDILHVLGATDVSFFEGTETLEDEFKLLKRSWRDGARRCHPDKGGDPAEFRKIQAAFDSLRDLKENENIRGGTFTSYFGGGRGKSDGEDDFLQEEDLDDNINDLYERYANSTSVPSYEYYEAAAEEDVPAYKVELAKSGRSMCKKCKDNIENQAIRVGSLDLVAGSYGRWNHLACWRVPKKVQAGLTNYRNEDVVLQDLLSMEEVLLTGLYRLSEDQQRSVCRQVMDPSNWAGRKKTKAIMADESAKPPAKKARRSSSSSIVPGSFVVLLPGIDGAVDDNKCLKGKTFVLAGCFPEAGGGEGDKVGVENIKSMITGFGGKANTRFSKKTDYLLVGMDAKAGKFGDAKEKGIDILSLRQLQGILLGHHSFADLKRLPTLSSDQFAGHNYQPAGAAPPIPKARTSFDSAGTLVETEGKPAVEPPKDKKKAPKKDTKKKESKKKNAVAKKKEPAVAAATAASSKPSGETSTAVVPSKPGGRHFVRPKPGKNGGIPGALEGKRLVLTGIFPELGGGASLNIGKDRMKEMIEEFGGKVTGSVSGKTDYVIVGKDPGRSKVTAGEERGIPLLGLMSLRKLLCGQEIAGDEPVRITHFSAGYPSRKQIEY